jgi:hypothetical protein
VSLDNPTPANRSTDRAVASFNVFVWCIVSKGGKCGGLATSAFGHGRPHTIRRSRIAKNPAVYSDRENSPTLLFTAGVAPILLRTHNTLTTSSAFKSRPIAVLAK